MKETRRMQQAEQFQLEQDINDRFADAKRQLDDDVKLFVTIVADMPDGE